MKKNEILALSLVLPLAFAGCSAKVKTKMTQDISANETKKIESDYTGPKRRIGVVNFENKTAYGQRRLGEAASDILVTELVKTGKFIVVERDALDKIMAEQKLALSGAIDSKTAAKMGKVLGLSAIVTGAISNFGTRTTGSDYLLAQSKKQEATCTIDVRVVDAETGEVLLADSGKGVSKVGSGGFLGMGTKGGYAESMEGDALRAAISQLVINITSQVNKKPWSCRVAQATGDKVYLSAGSASGLKIGQKLALFSQGKEIKDPDSGLVLGYEEEELGVVQVTHHVNDKLTIATVVSGSLPSAGDMVRLKD